MRIGIYKKKFCISDFAERGSFLSVRDTAEGIADRIHLRFITFRVKEADGQGGIKNIYNFRIFIMKIFLYCRSSYID